MTKGRFKNRPKTFTALEDFGRVRLSQHFYMRDFLYSEISNFFGRPNLPQDPQLCIAAGEGLCQNLLDPMVETFGPIGVRSSYRSPELNQFGSTEVRPQKMASNSANSGAHIWDVRTDDGRIGATACIAVPWFADQYEQGRDWRDMAAWLREYLPFHEAYFFPKLCAFNLTWLERPAGDAPAKRVLSYIAPKGHLRGNPGDCHDFPPFRAIKYPPLPERYAA